MAAADRKLDVVIAQYDEKKISRLRFFWLFFLRIPKAS